MVLFDTSVWIRFLANRMRWRFRTGPLAREGRSCRARPRAVPDVDLLRPDLPQVAHGRRVGWIDAHLLASALVGDASLWTADEHLARLATELGIAYRPRPE